MTNNNLTDECLAKILSETQKTITKHNSRCVRGSVEVDARLFEGLIMELQLHRKAAGEDHQTLRRLAVILSGSDAPGEMRLLTVTASSMVKRCATLSRECEEARRLLAALQQKMILSVRLPDPSSKAFWGGSGKNETFYPSTYQIWVKEAIERAGVIAGIEVEVKPCG